MTADGPSPPNRPARGRSERLLVTRVDTTGELTVGGRRPDELVVEEPLSVQLDGVLVSTTMRTPGHDYELAVGSCFTDGLLAGAPVTGVRYCAGGSAMATEYNVVTVDTGGRAPTPTARLGVTSSSCGLCGTDQIDTLADRLRPLDPALGTSFPLTLVPSLVDRVLDDQSLFTSTGAVHAAAAFDAAGNVLLVREDVGRHNAVDKVVGRLLLDGGLPASSAGLFVSGRASFEIIAKAWAAGFPFVVAVSAPTALAVATARRAGIVLAGFVRPDGFNVYAPERLPPAPIASGA